MGSTMGELPSRQAQGAGIIGAIAAATVGAIAVGFELERQVIGRRLRPRELDTGRFYGLRGDVAEVTATDGVRLHTEVDEAPAAPAGAPTVVFVHGYVLSQYCWYFQRQALRGRRRLVLYDQRSHGRSERSEPEHCRVPQLGADLRAVLAATTEPDEPVVLVGHSMGGMTIMDYARRFPEEFDAKVRGVGLVATSAGDLARHSIVPGVPGNVFATVAPGLLTAINRAPRAANLTRRFGSDIERVITQRFSFGADVPPDRLEFMSQMVAHTPLEVVADFYPAFAQFDGRPGLERIQQVEAMVCGGERDVILPVVHTRRIIALLPGAESWIDPRQGHMHFMGDPDPVNDLVAALLDRVERHRARR